MRVSRIREVRSNVAHLTSAALADPPPPEAVAQPAASAARCMGEANASPLSRGVVAEEEAQRREARRAAEQIRAFLNLSEGFLNPGGRGAFVLPCSRRRQDGSTFTGRQGKRLARRRHEGGGTKATARRRRPPPRKPPRASRVHRGKG